MKQVIKINGKKMGEITLRNGLHFEVQKKTRMQIQKSKKTYTRKNKYKPNYEC